MIQSRMRAHARNENGCGVRIVHESLGSLDE